MPEIDIVLPNVQEFSCRSSKASISDESLRHLREIGNAYADLSLFWCYDPRDKLIITPQPISGTFIEHIRSRLGPGDLNVTWPARQSSSYSKDILEDKVLLEQVVNAIARYDSARIVTWGATREVYEVIDAVRQRSSSIITCPELPASTDYWTSMYFDTKSGCRHLYLELSCLHPKLRMAEGYVCNSVNDAMEMVAYFRSRGRGSAVKANTGAGGFGTILVGMNEALESAHARLRITSQLLPYFIHGPIIVEERLGDSPRSLSEGVVRGAVFLRMSIGDQGEPELIGGGCEMRNLANEHVGAELGVNSEFERVSHALTTIARPIAFTLQSRGYRGQLGLDFILDENDNPYLLEMNLRRSGESHVFDLGTRLFGSDWQRRLYAISRLPVRVRRKPGISLDDVLSAFDASNEELEETTAFPTSVSWLSVSAPGLGYVLFGPTREQVVYAEQTLHMKLAARGIKVE